MNSDKPHFNHLQITVFLFLFAHSTAGPDLETTLNEKEIEKVMAGAEILGCGGGGTIESAHELLEEVVQAGKKLRIQDVDSLPAQAVCSVVSGVGGGLSRIELAKIRPYFTSKDNPSRLQTFIEAVRLLSNYTGEVHALLPSEIGAGNIIVPLATSAMLDIVTLDADCCGRAKPEIAISTTALTRIKPTPMALVSPFGEGIVVRKALDDVRAEQLARACAVASGGRLACARSPMQGHEVRESVIRGSYSRALEMGDKIVGARERGKDLVEVLSHHFGFKEVFAGMVVEWVSRKAGAFLTGHLTITGEGVWKDRLMRIDFKNEYLVAFLDGLPYVTCPDLITVVDRETQKPLSNWANTYTYLHKPVSVLYKKAADVWHTRAGLTLFSPLHFGYSFGYTNAIDANAQ